MANLGSIIAQPTGFTLATIAMHDSRMAAYSTTVAVKQSSSKWRFVIGQLVLFLTHGNLMSLERHVKTAFANQLKRFVRRTWES